MSDFKFIESDEDLKEIEPLDWDVVVEGIQYRVYRVPGYVHTIGGRWGDNDLYACIRNTQPHAETLIPFRADDPVCWGIIIGPYLEAEYDDDDEYKYIVYPSSVDYRNSVKITRNGQMFNANVKGGVAEALSMIKKYREHPLELDMIDFNKKAVGRKVYWRSEPGIIAEYLDHEASVVIVPDGIDEFTVPAEFMHDSSVPCYEDSMIVTSILDEHIWWFREE